MIRFSTWCLAAAATAFFATAADAQTQRRPAATPASATTAPTAAPLAPGEERVMGNVRVSDGQRAREVRVDIGKALILELPQDAQDILVANPQVANAIVRSARRVFVIGTGVGSTALFFFGANGQQIAAIDVVVERDLEGLNRTLRRLFPNTDIKAEGIGENVVVSGQVNSAGDAKTAIEVAERFVGQLNASNVAASSRGSFQGGFAFTGSQSGSRIVNALTIAGKDQVQLRVVVAEMNRRALQQLGVNFAGDLRLGGNRLQFNTQNSFPLSNNGSGQQLTTIPTNPTLSPVPAFGSAPGLNSDAFIGGGSAFQAQLRAFEQTGLARTLAEPALTAVSGESATFLAGGEFPVPVARDRDGNILLEFKQFGVGLAFTPVVLSEGRISLRMRTEVSELDPANGFTASGGFFIPGLNVRRADSTVELPTGGTIVMAGLIRDQTRRSISGVPGLRRLPVLGRLFSSQDFVSDQSELVILVTPYIVNPVARRDIALPTDGFVNASDPEALLYNRINAIYGVRNGQQNPRQRPHGRFGYIYE